MPDAVQTATALQGIKLLVSVIPGALYMSGALFMLFWVFFAVSFYLLQRRNFRQERKKYLKKMSECESRVEKVFMKFNNEIESLSKYLDEKIEKGEIKK